MFKRNLKRSMFLVLAIAISIGMTPVILHAADNDSYLGTGKITGKYWPTQGWKTAKPEEAGMNSKKLLEAFEYAKTPAFNTDGLLVVRKGHIVGEAYYGSYKAKRKHISNSMAKSFSSTLIGIAIDKGIIKSVDEKLCQWYEDWDCDDAEDERSKITIRHAMTLTSGLEWEENWTVIDPETNDALIMGASGHFVEYMSERDGLHEPGKKFYYSTGDPMLLSKVIKETTGMHAFNFAKKHLFKPLNITKVRWGRDRDGYTATAWGLYMTVRDYAKFGYLFLNKGKWEDKQVVSEGWVEKATKTDPSVAMWQAYGWLWHVNLPLRLKWSGSKESARKRKQIPADGYMAEGVAGQNIYIIPSKDLVIVKVANQKQGHIDEVKLLTLILDAIEE